MTNLSELYCIRGCTSDLHFAACPDQGEGGACAGCAPALVVKDLVVCDDCRRRIRGLLRQTPDLLGRMRSLAAHGKAVVYAPVKVFSAAGPASAPEPVDADLVDAMLEISTNLRAWSRYVDMVKLDGLDRVLGDVAQTLRLAAAVIDTHDTDEDGGRHWSVADAMGKWGAERRGTAAGSSFVADAETVTERKPVAEWRDRILIKAEAEVAAGSARTLRRWVKLGEIKPEGQMVIGGVVTVWYRGADIAAVKSKMQERQSRGRDQEDEGLTR